MALWNLQLKRRCRAAIQAGAIMCLLFPVSCHRAEDPEAFLKQEIARLQEITIPPDGEPLVSSAPDHRAGSETANLEFKTEWRSEQYFRWVIPRLSKTFRALGEHNSQLTFSRNLDGDAETVRIQIVSQVPELHIRVTLEIYPD